MTVTKRFKKAALSSLVWSMLTPLAVVNTAIASDTAQPEISALAKDTLIVDGNRFKDLNANGRLDPYEDWRLPVDQRVEDLVSRMTLEEKTGMMLASSHYMGNSNRCPAQAEGAAPNGLLCENDVVSTTNNWAVPGTEFYELNPPVVSASGTTRGILERGLRYLIIRDNPSAKDLTTWTNKIQEVAEGSRLGIPAVMVSNPRNHVGNLAFGFMEASGQFSSWPGELGLAATQDPDLVREFAEIARKEWDAAGVRKGYMYMADIVTDPLWNRTNGTFGEHPDLSAALMTAVIKGFQGEELGPNSVSMTTKHFPGGGTRLEGHDPHYAWGKPNPYPTEGSLLKYHVPSFKASFDAGSRSVMPYYAKFDNSLNGDQLPAGHDYAEGQEFEEVGFAYNKYIIQDLLRDQLGFKGYVNSDTGIIYAMPWGVEGLTRSERYAKAVEAGVDLFSGEADPADLTKAVRDGLITEERINISVGRLLTEMMDLGLFENPYRDPDAAQSIADDPVSQQKADEAHRKSVVLLRNDSNILPLNDAKIGKVKLYVEVFAKSNAEAQTAGLKESIEKYDASIQLTDNLDEATHALLYAIPSSVPDRPDAPLSVQLGTETGIDVEKIRAIEDKVPTILTINMTSPWLIREVEEKAAAVLAVFGVKAEALVDVIRGDFAPTGKLPFSLPASQEALEASASDVPGYDEDPSYFYRDKNKHVYKFGYGLNYHIRGSSVVNEVIAAGKPVTRAEFIVKLLQAYGLDQAAAAADNFADVSASESYYTAVKIARGLGITVGVGNNKFKPNQHITEQEMNMMAERAERAAVQDEI